MSQTAESREAVSTHCADTLLAGQQLSTPADVDASGVKILYMFIAHAMRPVGPDEPPRCQVQAMQITDCEHVQPKDYWRPHDGPVLGVGSEVEEIKTITTSCGVSPCESFARTLDYICSTKRAELEAINHLNPH